MGGLTQDIAAFVSALDPADLPDRCIETASTGMTDCVGVMIAGCDETAVGLVGATVQEGSGDDVAPAIPSGRRLAPADAALVNGVAGHVLDFDDVGIDGHTSVVLTPAILAEGWHLNASGGDALAAYAAGYEAWALLDELEPGHLHDRGFHPTAVTGTLAVAAACARLHRLSAEQTAHAIAIAASLASGVVANFGTMTKSLHAGRAAQSGVIAARLAASGFTGSPDVLEHRTGFMRAHSASGNPDVERGDWQLGKTWRMLREGINVKRYPICYATHRSIDAMLALVESHSLTPADVSEVMVHMGTTARLMLRNHSPKTGLEAKFSLEFAMASSLVAGRVGLAELTDEFVSRGDVVDAMKKVTCTTTDETMVSMPFAPADTVSVRLTDGSVIAHPPVAHARGSWDNPLTRAELQAKFRDCCRGRLPDDQAETAFARLIDLKDVASLRDLPLTAS